MEKLSELGYITYTLDLETRKLSYKISDWVVECCGKECEKDNVYVQNIIKCGGLLASLKEGSKNE